MREISRSTQEREATTLSSFHPSIHNKNNPHLSLPLYGRIAHRASSQRDCLMIGAVNCIAPPPLPPGLPSSSRDRRQPFPSKDNTDKVRSEQRTKHSSTKTTSNLLSTLNLYSLPAFAHFHNHKVHPHQHTNKLSPSQCLLRPFRLAVVDRNTTPLRLARKRKNTLIDKELPRAGFPKKNLLKKNKRIKDLNLTIFFPEMSRAQFIR